MRTFATLACLGSLLIVGCKRDRPSTDYLEASGSYTTLLAEMGDDAYADERMAHIEELLRKVPQESRDWQSANQLLATINAERRRIEAEAAAHQKALEAAGRVPDFPSEPEDRADDRAAAAAAAAALDAGSGPSGELARGITVDELRRVSGDCFNFSGPLRVRRNADREEDAEIYKRRDVGLCSQKYPQYPPGRIVVFVGGKLMGSFDEADLKHEATQPPPQVVRPEGSKPPQQPAPEAAPPPALPPGTIPGLPAPGSPVPNAGEQTGPAPTDTTP